MNDFKYVFGPIPSRRLGRSLGISTLPKKTCNYSCIYCQLGRTDKMTNKRQEFYKTEDIIAEFKQYLKDSDKFDIVTVVGEGEPTLAANLGELVVALKALTDKPVAVITNGALLSDPQVREELCHADMVLPSLDAYNQEISKKIDRPYGTIKFEEEFEGLKKFTHMYEGELWLEIMLVDGINDDEQSILKFQELLKEESILSKIMIIEKSKTNKELKENIEKINSHILHQKYGLSQGLKNSVEIIKLLKNNNILTERLLKNEIDKFKGQEMNLILMRELLKDTITLEAFDKYTFSGYTKGDFDSNPKFIDPTQYFKDMINFVDNYDENLLYYALDGLENRLGLESQERLAHMEEVKKQNEEYQTALENGILI